MDKKVFEKIVAVFQTMGESGILNLTEDISEDTVLLGDNAILDSVAFVTFFIDLESELETWLGREITLSVEDILRNDTMDDLDVRGLIAYIEKHCLERGSL